MSAVERMVCDGEDRFAFPNGSVEFDAAVAKLSEQFGPIDGSGWYSVSTPQYNAIYEDDIVSAVIRAKPAYLDSFNAPAVGRKFFLRKGWIYDKVYTFTSTAQCPLPRTDVARPMFIGRLVNVFGQPGDEDLSRYQCLYFSCPDHAAIEQWAGHELPKGAYSTFYSATFDTGSDNRLLRMKTYCYDEQGGFSDWDVKWMVEAKARNVFDAEISEWPEVGQPST
jgi:hypothetical protein